MLQEEWILWFVKALSYLQRCVGKRLAHKKKKTRQGATTG